MPRIRPVVLCGGNGSRLWPRSRVTKPKPFLPLLGAKTMFDCTLERFADRQVFAPPMIVTGEAHLKHVEAQAPAICPDFTAIIEPAAKNTAAAIALAAHGVSQDTILLVSPSDHHIADLPAFLDAVSDACALAAQDWLVAFGIQPTSPETGFGYIKRGERIDGGFRIQRFTEKPDAETARQFLADGGYSWNGGIFAFRAGQFLSELKNSRPELSEAVARSVSHGSRDRHGFRPDAAWFAQVEPESVDYAIMETTSRAAMVPADMGWSDIGSWSAIYDARFERDDSGNAGVGSHEFMECRNVLVDTDGPRVSAIGLENIVVVVDGDEVLVTSRMGAQLVGKTQGAANQ